MPKYTRNSGRNWTPAEVSKVRDLAKGNTPTRVIGLKVGRTPAAIYKKASEEGIPLTPPNQPPYSRKP